MNSRSHRTSGRNKGIAIAAGLCTLSMALTSCSAINQALGQSDAPTSTTASDSALADANNSGSSQNTGAPSAGNAGVENQGANNAAGQGTSSAVAGGSKNSSSPNSTQAQSRDLAQQQTQRKVYHSSEGWEFLENPDGVMPGGRYFADSATGEDGECSFGWWVMDQSQPDRSFIMTAGHCGEEGDTVSIETSSGEMVEVGEFIWSDYRPGVFGPDYGLIELNLDSQYVSGTPPIEGIELAGYADGTWLEQTNPYICRPGFRTGLSCGQFRELDGDYVFSYDGIADHGDSGGAVFAVDPQDDSKIYAVGMTSFRYDDDATNSGAATLAPAMEEFGLSIVS